MDIRRIQDTNMHNSHIFHTVQLSPAAKRGVQVWRHPVLGHLFVLVARGCAADDAVAAGNRAPQPPGPSWSVESRAYITRLVVLPMSLSVVTLCAVVIHLFIMFTHGCAAKNNVAAGIRASESRAYITR